MLKIREGGNPMDSRTRTLSIVERSREEKKLCQVRGSGGVNIRFAIRLESSLRQNNNINVRCISFSNALTSSNLHEQTNKQFRTFAKYAHDIFPK